MNDRVSTVEVTAGVSIAPLERFGERFPLCHVKRRMPVELYCCY